jgi:hypothetical protein
MYYLRHDAGGEPGDEGLNRRYHFRDRRDAVDDEVPLSKCPGQEHVEALFEPPYGLARGWS